MPGGSLTHKVPKGRQQSLDLQNSKQVSFKLYHTDNFKTKGQNIDPGEEVHNEPPHLYLCCFQIQLQSTLVISK